MAAAAEACGLTVPAFEAAFWKPRLKYDAGLLEPVEYWRTVMDAAGVPLDESRVPDLVQHEVGFWKRFDERALGWNDRLRAGGIRTGMLSNLPRVLGEELRAATGLFGHFDHLTLSYELRVAKPEAAIYRHAVEGLGVEPGEALFLDDKAVNVEGARAVGLPAELFTSWEEFVATGVAGRYGLPRPLALA